MSNLQNVIKAIVGIFSRFWRQHPALLYAFAILIGFYGSLNWNAFLFIPFLLLIAPLFFTFSFSQERLRSRLLFALSLLLAAFVYVKVSYIFPSIPAEGKYGTAHINISSLSSSQTHFGRVWTYRCELVSFVVDEDKSSIPIYYGLHQNLIFDSARQSPIEALCSERGNSSQIGKGDEEDRLGKVAANQKSSFDAGRSIAKNVPCLIKMSQKEGIQRPPADFSYIIHALLKEPSPGQYILTVPLNEPWHPLAKRWNFVETRFTLKNSVKTYIQQNIQNPRAANFLAGIATGEFDDRLLQFEFSRFGLQHIMAISGFHFGIIAAILSAMLRICLPKKQTAAVLIVLLTTYYIFLGFGPSIMRAWITIMIVLVGDMLEKRPLAINSLGVALLAIFLFDPLMCRTVAFQLSFLSTAAILTFFSGSDLLLQRLWIKRPLSKVVKMNSLNQHGFVLLAIFRQGLALSLAVNIVTLPMMLYYFHKFPLMSLVYNLFFPFMVSLAMLLLILGMLFQLCCPPLALMLHTLNSHYTQFMLNFTFNMPLAVDVYWRVGAVPELFIISYLTLLLAMAITLKNYLEKRHEKLQDLQFL